MFYKHLSFIKQYIQKHLAILAAPLVLVLVLSLLPEAAHAGTLGSILSALTYIPLSFAYLILALVTLLSGLVAELCGAFLNWITGPAFITLKYTNNEFVNLGLGITKNFVNLILVVFLIYIALAIALRLKERATKQTLVYLIIIALLVNFAPVFCGLIVDATNIVQNYFLAGIQKGVSGIVTDSLSLSDLGKTANTISDDWAAKLGIFTKLLLIIIMNISIAFALLLFAAIFFFRLIAIWILVILSPLAFVAWILPATKKFWTLWWNQFIQWSIIGIPLAFFLYLVMATTTVLNNTFRAKMTLPGISTDTVGLLNMVLPYIAITALLYFGFVIGLKTSAMGASSAIKMTKGLGKWTGRKALGATAFGLEKARANLPESVRKWGERQMTTKKWGADKGGVAGAGLRALSTINPLRYARRGFGALIGGKTVEAEQKAIEKAEKAIPENATSATLLSGFNAAMTDDTKIAYLNTAIKRKKLGDMMDEKKFGENNVITKEQLAKILKKAKKIEADGAIKKAVPDVAAKYLVTEEDIKDAQGNLKDPKIDTYAKFIVSKMNAEDYKNIAIESLKDDDVMDAILHLAKPGFIQNLINAHGMAAINAIEQTIVKKSAELNLDQENYLEKTNSGLRKFLMTGPGAGLITIPSAGQPAEQPGKIIFDNELAEKKEQAQKEYEKKQKEQEEQKQKESPKPKKPGLTGEGSGYVGGGAP